MLKNLKSLYRRQMFFPGWIGIFINPFYFARAGLRAAMARLAPELGGRLLDVGCGTKPYQELFPVEAYVGLDIDSENARKRAMADHFYDGNSFPFEDDSFDSALCNQVLEHVFNPDQFLSEIWRVLKPGGKFLLTVPFMWDEHEQPWDYARYSSFGLKSLLERNGFEILAQHKINADARAIFQLVNAYLYKISRTRWPLFNLLICAILLAPFNIAGTLVYRILPGNPDLYLDQAILARKVQNG